MWESEQKKQNVISLDIIKKIVTMKINHLNQPGKLHWYDDEGLHNTT